MTVIGANAGLSLLQKAAGIRTDPYIAHNFLVEIEGIIAGGFTDVSGLTVETTVDRKMFGGENDIEYKFITATKYTDLTLKHGLTDLDLLWGWYEDVTNGIIKRRSGTIYLLDHAGLPAMWWDFLDAYPIKWDGPVFNAATNTVATESLTLTHQGLRKPKVSKIVSAIRGSASASLDLGF